MPKPIDLTANNTPITPEQVAHPVGCGGTCGGKCGSGKKTAAHSGSEAIGREHAVDNTGLPAGPRYAGPSHASGWSSLVKALILAGGIAYAGYMIGGGLADIKAPPRFITVPGAAERIMRADTALWNIGIYATGEEIDTVTTKINDGLAAVRTYLTAAGIDPADITDAPSTVKDMRDIHETDEQPTTENYLITAGLRVRSAKIDVVRTLSGHKMSDLLQNGVGMLEETPPSYLFTKAKELQPAMLAEAIKDARKTADQAAGAADVHLGGLLSVVQSDLQTTARDQTEDTAETSEIDKKLTLKVAADYYLEK